MKIVIKVGTSSLMDGETGINEEFFNALCESIVVLRDNGHDVAIVTSGAIGLGRNRLLNEGNFELAESKTICAAVGQPLLMQRYEQEFGGFGITVAQVLLAGENDYVRKLTRETLNGLLSGGVLQIINANDTVYDKEIRIGDNDTLSAMVAKLVQADKLVILTDVDGFRRRNLDGSLGEVIKNVQAHEIEGLKGHAEGSGSELGTGGMKTKLKAAEIAAQAGCDTYIVNNGEITNLLSLVEDSADVLCTKFLGVPQDRVFI